MGKGRAKLGKEEKGANNADEFKPKPKVQIDSESVLKEDIKMLEHYEAIATVGEQQRLRLQKLQAEEEGFSAVNKATLRNIHRKMLREEKAYHLRKEIDIMAQNHERDVARKDVVIQMLLNDLDDAEEQMQVAQRSHMVKIQELIEIHRTKAHKLNSEFERELKEMKSSFLSEREVIVSKHDRDMSESKAIMKAVERHEYDKRLEDKRQHRAEREDIRGRNLEEINELRIALEQKIIDLEKQFDEAHSAYSMQTKEKNDDYKSLMEKDKRSKLKIDSNKRKIERLEATLEHWRKKMELNKREFDERNRSIKEQKEVMAKHCAEIKADMTRFRQNEQRRLVELTSVSRTAKKSNEALLEQAERILQLAELNRRMLTEKEKVLPLYDSSTGLAESGTSLAITADAVGATVGLASLGDDGELVKPDPDLAAAAQAAGLEEMGPTQAHWDQLENYYKLYNKVLLDKFAIQQEQERLFQENLELRAALKSYLDGIAVAEDVVDRENPLLIVNGRTGRELPVRRRGTVEQPTVQHVGVARRV